MGVAGEKPTETGLRPPTAGFAKRGFQAGLRAHEVHEVLSFPCHGTVVYRVLLSHTVAGAAPD